jgi:hypothetical protein
MTMDDRPSTIESYDTMVFVAKGQCAPPKKENPMQYNNLGKTGLKVSRLCLGMMTYGSKTWRDWVLDEEQAKPFVKRRWMRVLTSLTQRMYIPLAKVNVLRATSCATSV